MKEADYSAWVEATVTELMDAKLADRFGPIAGEWLAFELGLSDSDVVYTDGEGEIVLSTPMAVIGQRIAAVRKARTVGRSALDVLPWRE
jgi:hypothetical protein